MARATLLKSEFKKVDDIVQAYVGRRSLVRNLLNQVLDAIKDEESGLEKQIHSVRSRVKDPDNLRHKLGRMIHEAKSDRREFNITPENLFEKVNDLAGVRLLHLHTRQFQGIDETLRGIFEKFGFPILEKPKAKTWDDESREYFKKIGVGTERSETMYTSVHYVISSGPRAKLTCEIQVRTLAEELWGEVSHDINYPTPTKNVSCEEQIKTLARATSTATRLVDSIYRTRDWDVERTQKKPSQSAKTGRRRHK